MSSNDVWTFLLRTKSVKVVTERAAGTFRALLDQDGLNSWARFFRFWRDEFAAALNIEVDELDAHCFKRAHRLIVDSRDSARNYGEVHRWLKQGALKIEDIHGELGEVLAAAVPGRRSTEEITIAKLVGIGVQDLAAAEVAVGKLKQAVQDLMSSISGLA